MNLTQNVLHFNTENAGYVSGATYSMNLLVENAGISAANGVYTLVSGTGNSRVWTNGTYGIAWFSAESAFALYAENDPSTALYVGSWLVQESGQWSWPVGASPGPFVGYASFSYDCNISYLSVANVLLTRDSASNTWSGTYDPEGENITFTISWDHLLNKWSLTSTAGATSTSKVCDENVPPWNATWYYNNISVVKEE